MDLGARPLLALPRTAAGLTCSSGSGKAQFLFHCRAARTQTGSGASPAPNLGSGFTFAWLSWKRRGDPRQGPAPAPYCLGTFNPF